MWCQKGGLLFIWLEHRNLMVTGEHIYEREHLVTGSGIHYLVYPRQWEAILWANIIQVGVIDIDSPFTPFFFGTTTTFVSHFEYSTSLINLDINNFSIST